MRTRRRKRRIIGGGEIKESDKEYYKKRLEDKIEGNRNDMKHSHYDTLVPIMG